MSGRAGRGAAHTRPAAVAASRILAVPLLGERGGGVGQASTLLWEAIGRVWPADRELIALLRNGSIHPDPFDKIRFGQQLAMRQCLGAARWVLFSHLGLARAERFVPRPFRVPYGVFLHGIEGWKRLSGREAQAVRGAAIRLANSAHTARRVMAANPDVGEVQVCHLALAAGEERAGERVPVRPHEHRRSVLVVGRMSESERYKGHEQILDVWADVQRAVPGAELIIAGDGDDRPRLEALARRSPAAATIRFVGFVDRSRLAELYADAAVFSLPSRGEGFGLVYLEAMAHRVPCLGSPHDAAGEVIQDGETGLLVEPEDRHALGRTLVDLLQNPDLRRRMGERGYERLQAQFTFSHFSTRLVTLLRESLEGGEAIRP